MPKSITYYTRLAKEMIENDKTRDKYIAEFRKILALQWKAPDELRSFEWWRDFVNSAPSDGMDAAVRTFSTIMPTVRILPRFPTSVAKEVVEGAEDALMYHFRKANQRAQHPPLELMVDAILKYGGVGIQVRYLPFDFKGWKGDEALEKRLARYRRQGDFVYFVHEPDHVHARFSPYGMEKVLLTKVMSAADLIDELGGDEEYKKPIQEIKDKVCGDKVNNEKLETYYLTYFDYTDETDRIKWASMTGDKNLDLTGGQGNYVEIKRKPHGLSFIPWIYQESRKPMLKPIVDSRSWENQNIKESLQYALLVATAASARTVAYSYDGKGIPIDYSNPGGQATALIGEKLENMPPAMTDPNLEQQIRTGEARITQQLATRALQAAEEVAGSAPYATFNAIMQAAISSLASHQSAGNAALENVFYNQLEWVRFSEIPLTGYRLRNRKGYEEKMNMRAGAEVRLGQGDGFIDIDPNDVLITARLRPNNPTDRQQRLNEAILLHDKFPISWDDALETAGIDDLNVDIQAWLQERFTLAVTEGETTKITGAAQLMLKAKEMEMQMQAQLAQMQASQSMQAQAQPQQSQQPPQNELNSGSMTENTGGMNPAAGMGSPSMMAPGQLSQEAVTGQSQTGEAGV